MRIVATIDAPLDRFSVLFTMDNIRIKSPLEGGTERGWAGLIDIIRGYAGVVYEDIEVIVLRSHLLKSSGYIGVRGDVEF
jgi:hypothetical protein